MALVKLKLRVWAYPHGISLGSWPLPLLQDKSKLEEKEDEQEEKDQKNKEIESAEMEAIVCEL